MEHHYTYDWPEWGSAPRRPLVNFDMAHAGEWLDSVVGDDPETGNKRVYHIVRCELCILTHVFPLLSHEALASYYQRVFYQKDKASMVERYEQDRPWWELCVHQPILNTICSFLGSTTPLITPRPTFLDIGAGVGIALDVAKHQYGFQTFGIEPNEDLCQRLSTRGHVVTSGSLEKFQGKQKFHVLYLYETLEHFPYPEESLLQCYDIMEHGGVIAVVVPNDYNPYQCQAVQTLGMAPWWLAPPQHLNYFTPKTLQLLLRRCGFTIRDMRGTYPIDKHILSGENYIGNDSLGRSIHRRRMQEELNVFHGGLWHIREEYYRENLRDRIGREIVAIAQKV